MIINDPRSSFSASSFSSQSKCYLELNKFKAFPDDLVPSSCLLVVMFNGTFILLGNLKWYVMECSEQPTQPPRRAQWTLGKLKNVILNDYVCTRIFYKYLKTPDAEIGRITSRKSRQKVNLAREHCCLKKGEIGIWWIIENLDLPLDELEK